MPPGEEHPMSKLTEDDVRAIRALVGQGVPVASVSREFGVAPTQVYRILRGETWKHVT